MFSQSIKIARSSVINNSLHVVALAQRYRGLGEGLFVELGLYPQEPFFGLEVLPKIEGRHDGRRSLFATQPDGVFGRLLEHFAILVGNQDPGPSLPLGRVLATLKLAAAFCQNESRTLDHTLASSVVIQVSPRRSGSRWPAHRAR